MNTGYGTSTRRCIAQFMVAGALAVGFTGCASNEGADTDVDGTSTATTTSASAAATSAAPQGAGIDALRKAGGTATSAVQGSKLISIEAERNGAWEVQVVTSDGTEHEMDVSSDGATVTSGPTPKNEDESDRTKHRDRLQAARVDYLAAADTVLTEVPNGTITELNLDSRNGITVWESDVTDGSQRKREVVIDAASAQVLENTTGR
jgi:uncharacterized membrane protein YkoI